jgi:hypothetical protein
MQPADTPTDRLITPVTAISGPVAIQKKKLIMITLGYSGFFFFGHCEENGLGGSDGFRPNPPAFDP